MDIKTKNSYKLFGSIVIPPDKSISHRCAMLAALTGKKVKIKNYSKGADCRSTLKIVEQLGAEVEFLNENDVLITAPSFLRKSYFDFDCGNSGTTMRLMSGILAGQRFHSTLIGDVSLSKRPMRRIISPLENMGAIIKHNDFKAPLEIKGTKLHGITYNSPIASAQVKSSLLFAGLFAEGETTVIEPFQSRNHTELLFDYMNIDIVRNSNLSTTVRRSKPEPRDLEVCGDISSAAFFMVAAAIVPDSDVVIRNVGINHTRAGIIDIMKKMGANIQLLDERIVSGEPVADIRVTYSQLKGVTIEGSDIPRLIDEIPVIAVLATQADGKTTIKDASDLRNKESNRIKTMVEQLRKIGAKITETEDGMVIFGKTQLFGNAEIDCYHDHRTAMSFYVAGLICQNPLLIKEFEWVNTSFPEFLFLMNALNF